MKRAWVLGILVAVGMSAAMFAEQEKPVLPMTIEKVKDNLYMISGAGGGNTGSNTAVYLAANGVVLVDTKYANYGQPILDQVKTVTNKPVTHIINTHTHGDHVGSNDFFRERGDRRPRKHRREYGENAELCRRSHQARIAGSHVL